MHVQAGLPGKSFALFPRRPGQETEGSGEPNRSCLPLSADAPSRLGSHPGRAPQRRRHFHQRRVEVVSLIPDHHQLAGLVGGDQERRAQPSQETRRNRRMDGLQRSRISTLSADVDPDSRSHDFASRRKGSWRMHRRDEENSPSSGGGHCEGKASLGASLLWSICQMSIGKRTVDRSNRLGGSGTAVPGRSEKVQWPTPEETRSPDAI